MISQADYLAFERKSLDPLTLNETDSWDYFLSAYDHSERVSRTFEKISADVKQWVVHEEYDLTDDQLPKGTIRLPASSDPPAIVEFVNDIAKPISSAKVCVDSTGFVRPHLLILLRALRDVGLRSFDVVYSDPVRYTMGENTDFTGPTFKVKQVPGYEGFHRHSSTPNDLLIIGAGYDHELIARVCEEKRRSKKYVLVGLPSLRPHMYQESVLRINRAGEWIGSMSNQQRIFASANHPFSAAQALSDLVIKETETRSNGYSPMNVYLCPLGPKPHVLGFALFYLRELIGEPASVLYPFAHRYPIATSQGISRTWVYRFEV